MALSLHHGKTVSLDTHADFASRNDRWLTPLPLIRRLGRFDLDPCGAPDHQTADEVWTPESIGDGLAMPWSGRVFLNPPYGRVATAWVRRMSEHANGTALLFARTDTDLFHDWVFPHASAIMFLRRRLRFLTPDGEYADHTAGAPSALIAYGELDARHLTASGLDGHIIRLR